MCGNICGMKGAIPTRRPRDAGSPSGKQKQLVCTTVAAGEVPSCQVSAQWRCLPIAKRAPVGRAAHSSAG
jgi:hypothetical protein